MFKNIYLPTIKDYSGFIRKTQIRRSIEFILDAQTYPGGWGERLKNLIYEILQLQTRNKTKLQN